MTQRDIPKGRNYRIHVCCPEPNFRSSLWRPFYCKTHKLISALDRCSEIFYSDYVVSIVTRLLYKRSRNCGSITSKGKRVFCSLIHRHWFVPWTLSSSDRSVKLTAHFSLLPRLGMCGGVPPVPHTSSYCAQKYPRAVCSIYTSNRVQQRHFVFRRKVKCIFRSSF